MLNDKPTTVFLFAHQDDEIGVFYEIERTTRSGERAICIYLTNGEWRGMKASVRDAESLRVLERLGVSQKDVFFLGNDTGIAGGQLPAQAKLANIALIECLNRFPAIHRIVTFAWEGGHEDHDAAFWLAVQQAHARNIVGSSRSFPFYRSSLGRFPFYTMFKPLPENGPVEETRIPFPDRFRYIFLVFHYRSQMARLLGLFPYIIAQYLWHGVQLLQLLRVERLQQRPHHGPPLYEKRGRARYAEVLRNLEDIQ